MTDNLLPQVKAMPLYDLISEYVTLKKKGNARYTGLCPFHSETTPSFWVYDSKGSYHCYGCGAHGSVIDFLMEKENLPFKDALREAAMFYGLLSRAAGPVRKPVKAAPRPAPEDEARRIQREIDIARQIYAAGQCATGTIVEKYLRITRNIPIDRLPGGIVPMTIRHHPGLEYWHSVRGDRRLVGTFPAMIAPITGDDRKVMAVHITYLDPKTSDKICIPDPENLKKNLPAKKIRGSAWAHGIRLGPAAPNMGTAEGIENGLTYMASSGEPVWVAVSLTNLSGLGIGEGEPHPRLLGRKLPSVYPDMNKPAFCLPATTQRGTIVKDSDSKDPEAAACHFERAARRMLLRGIVEVRMVDPPKGYDLNDIQRGKHVRPK